MLRPEINNKAKHNNSDLQYKYLKIKMSTVKLHHRRKSNKKLSKVMNHLKSQEMSKHITWSTNKRMHYA